MAKMGGERPDSRQGALEPPHLVKADGRRWCVVLDGAQNVLLIIRPGTGKTDAAIALHIQAASIILGTFPYLTIEPVNAWCSIKRKASWGSLPLQSRD